MYLAEWINVLLMTFWEAAQITFLMRFFLWHALISVDVLCFLKLSKGKMISSTLHKIKQI